MAKVRELTVPVIPIVLLVNVSMIVGEMESLAAMGDVIRG